MRPNLTWRMNDLPVSETGENALSLFHTSNESGYVVGVANGNEHSDHSFVCST